MHFAARGDPCCQLPGDLELTSLPGDRFQVAGGSRQLAGVEPQAAAAVRGLLAGPGLDAVAGVLQGEGRGGCNARGSQDQPSHSCIITLK